MSAFFIKNRTKSPKSKHFIAFPEQNQPVSIDERPFWEVQRSEALEILTNLYSHWSTAWGSTKSSFGDLDLSKSTLARINFYESEQQKAILSLLAKTLVAWERSDETAFSESVVSLAKEFRPSYAYLEADPEETFSLTDFQLSRLRSFITNESVVLKDSVRELQLMAWRKIDFGDNILSEAAAETLIRERLGLTYFDFVDSTTTPEFSSGYYPALLQDLTDQGL